MEIRIPLSLGDHPSTYQGIKAQLKQLELAVHHAQKSVESAEKEGIKVGENSFLQFIFPFLESYIPASDDSEEIIKFMRNFTSNFYDELQNVELRIILQ